MGMDCFDGEGDLTYRCNLVYQMLTNWQLSLGAKSGP